MFPCPPANHPPLTYLTTRQARELVSRAGRNSTLCASGLSIAVLGDGGATRSPRSRGSRGVRAGGPRRTRRPGVSGRRRGHSRRRRVPGGLWRDEGGRRCGARAPCRARAIRARPASPASGRGWRGGLWSMLAARAAVAPSARMARHCSSNLSRTAAVWLSSGGLLLTAW